MTTMLNKLSPSITRMIRMDHTHVLATFHRFTADTPADRKQAIVNTVCLALEIHAQLEEEIFYPALRSVATDEAVLAKSKPEHDEMRRLIGELRSLQPGDAAFDSTFQQLMRDVMHHVADEETVLLPAAERLLKDRLGELGAQMTKRRLQLAAPHTGEIASNTARAMPASTMVMAAGGLLAGGLLLKKALELRRH
ncbi:hemerythrin domain-containing protein [Aquabacterium sp. A7-Y]|uniref:hemerythrin domain-containing protein n=1 Tax=Aquabacterium sp. A7-Y TaxID=1349605 RepID=UPI00223CEAF3|nr:hemerythrin domain-containing protein [Aquabacterium sp. A7-Y]MCW7538764.1 hemerythrin domain-containing protein [Aquabacterium sp. A7-Y]